jgi:hypothetical protein
VLEDGRQSQVEVTAAACRDLYKTDSREAAEAKPNDPSQTGSAEEAFETGSAPGA